MATKAEVDEYQKVIDNLSTTAFTQIKTLLLSLDNPSPIAFRDALLATYPELMAPFLQASAEVAAVWYESLRSGTGLSGFVALPKPVSIDEQLEAGVRYALSPVFFPDQFIGSTVLSLLAGFTQKTIANSGRDTITFNADRDRSGVGYQRVPQAGCCAFCALMASRGAVYRSEQSAGLVVGRGVDASETAGKRGGQGKGVKLRGTQEIGNAYHAHCRCAVVPVFRNDPGEYLQDTAALYTQQYVATAGLIRKENGHLVTDLTTTLASWRELHGTK